VRPHDLLRLADGAGISYEGPVPAWVPSSLARAPWVVVRRAPTIAGLVPVGVRGLTRPERLAAFLSSTAVATRVTPEGLAAARGWRHAFRARNACRLGALRVLDAVDELFTFLGLAWGPTGSVGFELATGVAVAGPASDLDVVVRAPEPWSLARTRELVDDLARLPVRVDTQLDTPTGAVALAEYARGGRVLLRTPDGPKLVDDPWRHTATDTLTA
jgi:phosphoribosyl-dephospho-CoA transferase